MAAVGEFVVVELDCVAVVGVAAVAAGEDLDCSFLVESVQLEDLVEAYTDHLGHAAAVVPCIGPSVDS